MAIIRPAKVEDADGIGKVHVDSWRSTYRGIIPDSVLDTLDYEKRSEVRRRQLSKNDPTICTYVAEGEDGKILGFAMAGPRRDGRADYDGELYAIYIFKECQGQGIGRDLFLATARWLIGQGYKSMLIWVLKDNPTRKFYETFGGRELESKTIDIGGPIEEVSYGWPDLKVLGESL